eukprot:8892391-Pyramimonas_sp.AAC.1
MLATQLGAAAGGGRRGGSRQFCAPPPHPRRQRLGLCTSARHREYQSACAWRKWWLRGATWGPYRRSKERGMGH